MLFRSALFPLSSKRSGFALSTLSSKKTGLGAICVMQQKTGLALSALSRRRLVWRYPRYPAKVCICTIRAIQQKDWICAIRAIQQTDWIRRYQRNAAKDWTWAIRAVQQKTGLALSVLSSKSLDLRYPRYLAKRLDLRY